MDRMKPSALLAAAATTAASIPRCATDVLTFWFGNSWQVPGAVPPPNFDLWFGGTPDIDEDIRTRFGEHVAAAAAGNYSAWMNHKHSALALIVLLDQFALNIYRDKPLSFDTSAKAIPLSYEAIRRRHDVESPMTMRPFFYMPLMHSERLSDQEECVRQFEKMQADIGAGGVDIWTPHAVHHRDVVRRYGRFPGRNATYGRATTPEEQQYLDEGGAF